MFKFIPVFNLKQCPYCKGDFPGTSTYFYRNKNYADGLLKACKSCHLQRCKEWRERNAEQWSQINVANVKKWRKDNPEKFRVQRARTGKRWAKRWPEKIRASARRRHRRRPETSRRTSNRYLARKKGAEGTYTQADIDNLYRKQMGKCFYCDCDISGGYQIEHYIPLSKGGSNWPENLRLACKPCNTSKGDMMPDDFIAKLKAS